MKYSLIALMTDFGTEDGYVGAMKGRIYSIIPGIKVVDISHSIKPYDIRHGAFCLNNCYPHFPDKTIFVGVVDPGVGTSRQALVIKTSQHLFVGPDNGLFSYVIYREGVQAFRINMDSLSQEISPTFHGRDVFARVAARIAKGEPITAMAERTTDLTSFFQRPALDCEEVELEVVHIDHFGNLIFNFSLDDWAKCEKREHLQIRINDTIVGPVIETFDLAPEGSHLLNWDSSGFLQVAVNRGNASDFFSKGVGDKAVLLI